MSDFTLVLVGVTQASISQFDTCDGVLHAFGNQNEDVV